MGWLSWFQKKPTMDERAQRKRDQVLGVMGDVEQFMLATRTHIADRDMMIPRRQTFHTLYTLGTIEALGQTDGFDEAQHLAGLLLFLNKHSGMDQTGVSTLMGQCMSHQESTEGLHARQQGQDAILAWRSGDAEAAHRLTAIFAQMT